MAQQENLVTRETFCCSICLELLKEPVTPTCGHSYCMSCIQRHWDTQAERGVFSCPQCMKTFTPRPELQKNIMLAELVEELRKSELQAKRIRMAARRERRAMRGKIQQKQKDLKLLQQEVVAINTSADETVAQSRAIFAELIRARQQKGEEVMQQIRANQEAEVSRVKELQRKVEEEICKLKMEDAELQLLQSDFKTRAEFLKYSRDITADPNTAYDRVVLSEGNRKAVCGKEQQIYPDHPDRFTYWWQVLSTEGLTGQCYWEVAWKGSGVDVAVSYKNISRAGSSGECGFGFNDKSWLLECPTCGPYKFYHNKIITRVSGPCSCRVGVYLDHSAGVLSFYDISDTMTLLHKIKTTFTQPLHVGLRLGWCDVPVEFCKLE